MKYTHIANKMKKEKFIEIHMYEKKKRKRVIFFLLSGLVLSLVTAPNRGGELKYKIKVLCKIKTYLKFSVRWTTIT